MAHWEETDFTKFAFVIPFLLVLSVIGGNYVYPVAPCGKGTY